MKKERHHNDPEQPSEFGNVILTYGRKIEMDRAVKGEDEWWAGYEVAKYIQSGENELILKPYGHLYNELERLTKNGMLNTRTREVKNQNPRYEYHTTEKGNRARVALPVKVRKSLPLGNLLPEPSPA